MRTVHVARDDAPYHVLGAHGLTRLCRYPFGIQAALDGAEPNPSAARRKIFSTTPSPLVHDQGVLVPVVAETVLGLAGDVALPSRTLRSILRRVLSAILARSYWQLVEDASSVCPRRTVPPIV
jgi:hypothetical protein